MWDRNKFEDIINRTTGILFICGGAMNQESFSGSFSKIFTLHIDDKTLCDRLKNRINNDYGKKPHELAQLLEWNKGAETWAKQRGTILIDTTKDLTKVVDEILEQIN